VPTKATPAASAPGSPRYCASTGPPTENKKIFSTRKARRFSEDAERRFVDYLETFDGSGLDPLPLRLGIHETELVADFTGVAMPAPVNSTLAVTAASVLITLKSVLDPSAPIQ
jgi:N-methylhydantoinase B/oxoprolinase/acetone carboxylase alpha subunit